MKAFAFSFLGSSTESRGWRGGADYLWTGWLSLTRVLHDGLEGCNITVRQGATPAATLSGLLLRVSFPPGKGKEPFTFSGKALQPPATRPLESSVKTMAAYWFHLSVPSSTSDVRKWVISVGRFTAAIVGQMLHAKIVVFSRIWPATVCVSSYAPKNNFDF